MTKITALTADQEADLSLTRERWLAVGLSTTPIDREAAKNAVSSMYVCAGLAAPKVFIFLDSPRQGAMAAALLGNSKLGDQVRAQVGDQVWAQVGDQVRAQVGDQVWAQVWAQVGDQVRAQVWAQVWDQVRDQVRDQVGDQVWDQVRAQVRDQVWAQVGDQVGDQVRAQVWDQVRAQVRDQVRAQVRDQVWAQVGDQVWDQVRAQVRDQVWAQVRDQVWAQVRAQVGDQVGDQVRAQVGDQVRAQVGDQVWAAVYGAHDAAWLGFYDFFRSHFGLAEKAMGLMDVAKTCGWVWPFAGCVVITDRPATIAFDGEKRLNCATGPAIEYRDGFTVHAWHGVRIPAEWLNGSLDAKTAVSWKNVEQRRAAIEILGWPNVLSALDAKSMGGNPDPKIGELIEVQLPFEDEDGNVTTRALFLKAQCGTGRTIFEAVDPDEIDLDPRFDPAWCAQAWRDGYSPADWLPPSFRT